jgi:predicted enzyme related to lactoylglutathione lyase
MCDRRARTSIDAAAVPPLRVSTMASKRSTQHQQGLVVFAKNKQRMSAFYAQTLALEVEESAPSHDVLRGHGCEVVIHAIPRKYAVGIKLSRPPALREETPFKPVFVVDSLDAVRAAAKQAGGGLKPIEDAWRILDFVVLDGWDPEGNLVQFKQKA